MNTSPSPSLSLTFLFCFCPATSCSVTPLSSLSLSQHTHRRKTGFLPCVASHILQGGLTRIFQLKFMRKNISFILLLPGYLLQTGLMSGSTEGLNWVESRTILIFFSCMLESYDYLCHGFFCIQEIVIRYLSVAVFNVL